MTRVLFLVLGVVIASIVLGLGGARRAAAHDATWNVIAHGASAAPERAHDERDSGTPAPGDDDGDDDDDDDDDDGSSAAEQSFAPSAVATSWRIEASSEAAAFGLSAPLLGHASGHERSLERPPRILRG